MLSILLNIYFYLNLFLENILVLEINNYLRLGVKYCKYFIPNILLHFTLYIIKYKVMFHRIKLKRKK